ncbi:MAG: twin-arginine translocase subunit TatC [Humidesulfovibrio sp.]|nr:twin-arginine translocase subunit TatC [Humidesulfovibrio sp.]
MIGTTELLVVAVVALIVVDPKKLPDLMKGLGKALGEFKQMSSDVKRTIERESEMADFEKRKAEAHEQLYGEKSAQAAGDVPPEPAGEPTHVEPETPIEMPDAPADASSPPVAETVSETVAAPVVEPAPFEMVSMPAPFEMASMPAPFVEAAPPAEAEPAPAPAEVPADSGDAPPPPPPPPTGDDAVSEGHSGRMSLIGHLQDLRKGLTRSMVAILVGFLACYAFAGHMLKILMQPMLSVLKQSHFIYTLPTEAFFAEMWIAFVAGLFVASPFIFYQIWSFVAPGLYTNERRWIIPIALCSALFFTCGALFGYFVVFPFGFEFFASYASDILLFTPKLDEYLGFVLKLLFAFGIVFELPLFMFFLARLGIVSHVGLRAKRKYAILGAFIVAAALTPPDAISQTMMAVPLCILYEVGIWGAFFFGKKKKPEQAAESAPPPGEAAA